MVGELHSGLRGLAGSRSVGQAPGAAVLTVLQQQVVVAAVRVVWRAGVFQQGVAGHGLDQASIKVINEFLKSMLDCSQSRISMMSIWRLRDVSLLMLILTLSRWFAKATGSGRHGFD
jgi:hypothetical protein